MTEDEKLMAEALGAMLYMQGIAEGFRFEQTLDYVYDVEAKLEKRLGMGE